MRGADRTWWLEGLAEPAPAPGSEVEVTGTPRDEYTLTVATIRVTVGDASALATAAAVRGSTRVLVLRAFWGARPPARPTTATTRQKVITPADAGSARCPTGATGYPERSLRGSGSLDRATATDGSSTAMDQALAAARRRGLPADRASNGSSSTCRATPGGILGYGSFPGQHVVVFNTMDLNVVTHEQGHNIGLPHASSRECTSSAGAAMTWSSRCTIREYGDEIDTMGNRRAGHYNAFYKWRLGWLQRLGDRDVDPHRDAASLRDQRAGGQGDPAPRRRGDVLAGVPDADRVRPRDAAGHSRRPGSLPGRRPDPAARRRTGEHDRLLRLRRRPPARRQQLDHPAERPHHRRQPDGVRRHPRDQVPRRRSAGRPARQVRFASRRWSTRPGSRGRGPPTTGRSSAAT